MTIPVGGSRWEEAMSYGLRTGGWEPQLWLPLGREEEGPASESIQCPSLLNYHSSVRGEGRGQEKKSPLVPGSPERVRTPCHGQVRQCENWVSWRDDEETKKSTSDVADYLPKSVK